MLANAILPSNWVSGIVDLEKVFDYNDDDYPIEATGSYGDFKVDGPGGPPDFYHTYKYSDMGSGDDPVQSEYCNDPCEQNPCECGRTDVECP